MHDIIIIGAGPAGLTAAIYARRANKTVLLLEKGAFGGQITFSPKVENYPGFDSLSGTELADHFVEQALGQGADVEIETVTGIRDCGEYKVVSTEDGNDYQARAVIIAAGAKHRHLGLPNEDIHLGEGISFCAVCDGAFYKDKTVALVGGGNSALQEAILLSETCKQVTVVQNLDYLTGEQALQDILAKRDNVQVLLGTVVEALPATAPLDRVTLRRVADDTTYELAVDGLFVAIGLEPENAPFESVVALNEWGYVDAGEDCLTRTPGVFVAGDCRSKTVRQVTTATGDGAVAAIAACRYIDSL
ncbi:MAG: FAD-dependent oxidoreductase [Clostridia bacterium]|nr:FAD-dependent oxidoreductase [Clostridia bacterium]